MKLKYGRGNAMIELSGSLGASIEATIRRLAPTLLDRMEDAIEEIRDEAQARWPVGPAHKNRGRTHSRDRFVSGVRLADLSTVEGFILNEAPYAYVIKSTQNSLNGKSAWQELARKPAKAAAVKLAQVAREDIERLLSGGR